MAVHWYTPCPDQPIWVRKTKVQSRITCFLVGIIGSNNSWWRLPSGLLPDHGSTSPSLLDIFRNPWETSLFIGWNNLFRSCKVVCYLQTKKQNAVAFGFGRCYNHSKLYTYINTKSISEEEFTRLHMLRCCSKIIYLMFDVTILNCKNVMKLFFQWQYHKIKHPTILV